MTMVERGIALLLAGLAIASAADHEWNHLRDVTHRRTYRFALRDGACVTGKGAAGLVEVVTKDGRQHAGTGRVEEPDDP